jgi:hypothetical protein
MVVKIIMQKIARKGEGESHLMIEIGGLIILAVVAVMLYIIFTGGVQMIKENICEYIVKFDTIKSFLNFC